MSNFSLPEGDDKKLEEGFVQGAWVKVTTFNFLTSKIHLPVIWTAKIWKYFPTVVGKTGLTQNSTYILDIYQRVYPWS